VTQPARRFGRRRGGGGFRQTTDWARTPPADPVTVAANSFVLLGSVSALTVVPTVTIRRTIGNLWIASDQTSATEDQFGALGFFIANDTAIALGATALLDPVGDASDDTWFVWMPFQMEGRQLTVVANNGINFPFDSRGQRKMQQGQSVAVMLGNGSATNGLRAGISFSMLGGSGLQR